MMLVQPNLLAPYAKQKVGWGYTTGLSRPVAEMTFVTGESVGHAGVDLGAIYGDFDSVSDTFFPYLGVTYQISYLVSRAGNGVFVGLVGAAQIGNITRIILKGPGVINTGTKGPAAPLYLDWNGFDEYNTNVAGPEYDSSFLYDYWWTLNGPGPLRTSASVFLVS